MRWRVSRDTAVPVSPDLEASIARSRVFLSAVAILAVYVDPTFPTLNRWLALTGGPFTIDRYTLGVMVTHLAYSLAVVALLARGSVPASFLAAVTPWADVLFGALIALVTEGATSPFYVFFAFAVLAVGLRAGLRATLVVTAVSTALYLSLIAVSAPDNENFIIMRPAYLAITGYLVGYLGQQRLNLERSLRELDAAAQRRGIARSLHDGYAQALAGVNLRLESSRELMRRGRPEDAFRELTDLQTSVNREYDQLRAYIRSLVDIEVGPAVAPPVAEPQVRVAVDFAGSAEFVDHVLQILLEGERNVRRHANARHASIQVRAEAGKVLISIEDDGVGFPADAPAPWSIASRVSELAGLLELRRRRPSGAQLLVELGEA
ncbi:MAG TPA: histidine kinase [Myxococcota bacterium]|nr:histidine kinase [Myxococcota bacterium]